MIEGVYYFSNGYRLKITTNNYKDFERTLIMCQIISSEEDSDKYELLSLTLMD